MKKLILASSALLVLAACGGESGEAADAEPAAEPVDTMLPGNFLIRTEVTDIQSVDEGEPRTALELGQVVETNVCVGEDGILPAAAFGEEGDSCEIRDPYQRKGRLRQGLSCQREAGEVNLQVEADFTAEGIEGTVRSGSAFAGDGDYQLSRTLTGERTGDCTQAEADAEIEAEVVE